MLISHKRRFIFLKTEKTASTSLFRLLCELCSEDETFYQADQLVKHRLHYKHGRREEFSFQATTGGRRRILPSLFGLHTHAKARCVRSFIGGDVFDSYTVITSERNPWDRQVSLYCHRNAARGKLDLRNFNRDMQSTLYNLLHVNRTDNWGIYTLQDQVCADIVIRYENLQEDTAEMLRQIGFDGATHRLGRLRSEHRPKQVDFRELYTRKTRELVAQWYHKEIEHFGYDFETGCMRDSGCVRKMAA